MFEKLLFQSTVTDFFLWEDETHTNTYTQRPQIKISQQTKVPISEMFSLVNQWVVLEFLAGIGVGNKNNSKTQSPP